MFCLIQSLIVSICQAKVVPFNLQPVQQAFHELTSLGFNSEQVVAIVGHGGGSKNIAAALNYFSHHPVNDTEKMKIIKLLSRSSGHKKLNLSGLD